MQITNEQARRFLLTKQLLYPPQSLSGPKAIEEVFQHLRVVQYDPLNPCGRNPDLVLQARISNYHPDQYYQWLYEERKGIECYDKELCIIPIEDVSLTFHRHEKVANHWRIIGFFKEYQKEIETVEKQIIAHGPITSADVKNKDIVTSNWGVSSRFGRFALDTLWWLGRLVIVKRENGRKYYDIPSRVYGIKHQYVHGEKYEIASEHILRRVQSVGIMSASGSGPAWQGIGTAAENKAVIKTLIQQKKLIEIQVVDSKKTYIIRAEDQTILSKNFESTQSPLVFIAPLDTLMWDRAMIEDLFGFYYRWEVYTPLSKRQYGYYVLPILYGDTFIGRIEPVFKDGVLEIKGLWKEHEWSREEEKAFEKGLEQFRNYLGATEIRDNS